MVASAAITPAIGPTVERAAQPQQPAALGPRGQPAADPAAHVGEERLVGGQRLAVHLGEAAADHQPVDRRRQGGVGQRVEGHDLGAGRLERLHVVAVGEGEGGAGGEGEPRAGPSTGAAAGRVGHGERPAPWRPGAATASRSHWRATTAARRSRAARTAAGRSATGTSPRWRSRHVSASSRRSAPSTGRPSGARASRSSVSWPSPATRLRMTPATPPGAAVRRWRSRARRPPPTGSWRRRRRRGRRARRAGRRRRRSTTACRRRRRRRGP